MTDMRANEKMRTGHRDDGAMQRINYSYDPDCKKPKPELITWQAGGRVIASEKD